MWWQGVLVQVEDLFVYVVWIKNQQRTTKRELEHALFTIHNKNPSRLHHAQTD